MENIRTDYFTGNTDILPDWLPPSSLLIHLLRCLLDNHLQDAVRVLHHPYLLPGEACVLRREGLSDSVTLSVNSSNVVVPITNDPTDVYDTPTPFAWYDGDWLMVFNLHMGSSTGGSASTGNPDLIWMIEVPGVLLSLSDHVPGGRAYWRSTSDPKGWQLQVLESRGLFVPGIAGQVQCYYERRGPKPVVRLGDESLTWRKIWTRCDDVLRLYGLRRNLSPGSAFASIRGRLPGYPLFGLGADLGVVKLRYRWPVYADYVPDSDTSIIYGTSPLRLERRRYPQTISSVSGVSEYGETVWLWMQKVWWDGAPTGVVGALTDEVM